MINTSHPHGFYFFFLYYGEVLRLLSVICWNCTNHCRLSQYLFKTQGDIKNYNLIWSKRLYKGQKMIANNVLIKPFLQMNIFKKKNKGINTENVEQERESNTLSLAYKTHVTKIAKFRQTMHETGQFMFDPLLKLSFESQLALYLTTIFLFFFIRVLTRVNFIITWAESR